MQVGIHVQCQVQGSKRYDALQSHANILPITFRKQGRVYACVSSTLTSARPQGVPLQPDASCNIKNDGMSTSARGRRTRANIVRSIVVDVDTRKHVPALLGGLLLSDSERTMSSAGADACGTHGRRAMLRCHGSILQVDHIGQRCHSDAVFLIFVHVQQRTFSYYP